MRSNPLTKRTPRAVAARRWFFASACAVVGLIGSRCPLLAEDAASPATPVAEDVPVQQSAAPIPPAITSFVAPLFLHGQGRGYPGWAPEQSPAFLSDEEAFEIIADEARAAQIVFSPSSVQFTAATDTASLLTAGRCFTFDGVDATHKIAFVYLSNLEANMGRHRLTAPGLIEETDIRAYATTVRDRLAAAQPDGTFAVFYDPAVTITDVLPRLTESEAANADLQEQAHQLARIELRNQVRDFLAWLAVAR